MAKARPIPGLACTDTYALAAAKVVAVRAAELAEHSAGVLDLTDIERVHRMRVASRRLRAALEVFASCFPRKAYKRALREVKELADALGERRDRDVAIEQLSQTAAALTAADRPGIESLIARLRREQEAANEALAPLVSGSHLAALGRRLAALVDAARAVAGDDPGTDTGAVELERIPPPLSAPPVPAGTGNGASAR